MNVHAVPILDHLASLADPTRSRILLLLDRHELTVTELCGIMQLPQSTVSRHLKALADAGWIGSRAEGTSAACRPPSPSGAPNRRNSSPRRPVNGIACAKSSSAIAFIWPRSPHSPT